MHYSIKFIVICVAAAGASLVGCDRDDQITTYQAPKETAVATAPQLAMPVAEPVEPVVDGAAPITWTVPANWKKLPATEMRYASFQVSDAAPDVQLSVTPLGPENQVLPNLNRWEEQLGLPPSSEADAPKHVTVLKLADSTASSIDLVNHQTRMLAAIVPHGDRVWFFKLVGPATVVSPQKENFDAFVKSIRFSALASTSGGAEAQASKEISVATTWKPPSNWTEEPPKPMRIISYAIDSQGQKGEVIVTKMDANHFGSLLSNINRWRGQVGLQPLSDDTSIKPQIVTTAGRELALFDFVGPKADDGSTRRIIVTMSVNGPDVWFFKLQGPNELVGKEKDVFENYLGAVQFQAAGQ